MGVSSPPELVVKFLEPELQAVGWEDEGVSLDSLVKALHKSEEVNCHALCKLLPTGQLGSFSLNYLVCAAGNAIYRVQSPLHIYPIPNHCIMQGTDSAARVAVQGQLNDLNKES